MLVGISMPYHIALFWLPRLEFQHVPCAARYFTLLFPLTASIFCLLMLSLDRCLAVRYPLRYPTLVTSRRVTLVSLAAWLLAAIIGIVLPLVLVNKWKVRPKYPCNLTMHFRWEYFALLILPVFYLVTVMLALTYSITIWTVFEHMKTRRMLSGNSHVGNANHSSFSSSNIRVLVTGVIICAIFYICWLPFLVILSIQVYAWRLEDTVLSGYRTIVTFPAIANSFMNAFIYAWRLPAFRATVKEMCCIACAFKRELRGSTELSTLSPD